MRTQPRSFDDDLQYYVPGMQFSHDANLKGIVEVSLGSPAGYDEDGIHADVDGDGAVDLTHHSADFVPGTGGLGSETDAPYGQTVVMKVSADPGAGGVDIKVYGRDYLNQPMVETIVTASGATAAVESKKAFKRVLKLVLTNPATNAITVDVGWGTKLGLPYKLGLFAYGIENGVYVKETGNEVRGDALSFIVADAVDSTHTSPVKGYFIGWEWVLTTAMTAAASVITTALDGSDFNAGDFQVPVGAVGLSGVVSLDKADWGAVDVGDQIVANSDGAGTGGVINLTPIWGYGAPNLTNADTTDPATLATGDPRGLYDPQVAPDGTREYVVAFYADNAVNASGNGGLHGIRHFYA